MNIDAVFLGSMLTVVLSTVVVVYLLFKVKSLMDKDAESHKK
jgi:hypothetical protein